MAATAQNNTPAPVEAKETNVVVTTQNMINQFMEKGTLRLPPDYSPENALKSAWLILQETKTSSGGLALQNCSRPSIINALLDMVIQGLNPAKKQCYFIAYGQALVCQRSYFGDEALARRVMPGIEVFSGVVYEGDEFSYEIVRGRKSIVHRQKLENVHPDKIVAAYCGIVDADGVDLGAEVMTWEQIQASWGMSKTYKPEATKGTHHDFPDQMALRTVIRRRCKPIINSSNDELLLESVRRQEADSVEGDMDAEAAANANGAMLGVESLPDSSVIDATFTDDKANGAAPSEAEEEAPY